MQLSEVKRRGTLLREHAYLNRVNIGQEPTIDQRIKLVSDKHVLKEARILKISYGLQRFKLVLGLHVRSYFYLHVTCRLLQDVFELMVVFGELV